MTPETTAGTPATAGVAVAGDAAAAVVEAAGAGEVDPTPSKLLQRSPFHRNGYSRAFTAADSLAPSALPAAIAVAAFIT